jgi:uncharacterized protein (DUF1499 family)
MRLFPGIRPSDLGARDGKLKPAPRTPNGVSSQADPAADAAHYIAPLACNGDPGGTWARLVKLVEALPGIEIVTRTDGYLHAECSSKMLGFIDDLECLLDRAAKVIHVRSAARLGIRDFGVNRARVETLRSQLGARP